MMEGPDRMRDSAGAGLRRILASSALDEPGPGALERALKATSCAVVVATATTAAAKTAAAQSVGTAVAGAGPLGLVKWVGIGIFAGVMGLGALKVSGSLSHTPAPNRASAPATVASIVPVAPMHAQRPAVPAMSSAASSIKGDEPREESRTLSRPPDETPGVPSAAPANSSLAAEMQELELVRQAIKQGRSGEALRLLDAFAAQRPRARLSEEAAVLRIEALAASGETSEAKRLAAEHLRVYPASAFGDRIRSITGMRGEP
jgi:hypothetical protein